MHFVSATRFRAGGNEFATRDSISAAIEEYRGSSHISARHAGRRDRLTRSIDAAKSKANAKLNTLLEEQKRRYDAGDANWRIPFRPDHGHELLDDVGKATHPGYPAIGRLRGLAEIRGVMTAVASLRQLPV